MKFKEYVEGLQKFLKENPEAGEFVTICSSDDEGNSYHEVYHEPCIGWFDKLYWEFSSLENEEGDDSIDEEDEETNLVMSVCLN